MDITVDKYEVTAVEIGNYCRGPETRKDADTLKIFRTSSGAPASIQWVSAFDEGVFLQAELEESSEDRCTVQVRDVLDSPQVYKVINPEGELPDGTDSVIDLFFMPERIEGDPQIVGIRFADGGTAFLHCVLEGEPWVEEGASLPDNVILFPGNDIVH